ncbi:MAG TPA: hypothetical protein VMH92_08020 [Acidocella sp.]|nr:hypothetical protein [Acidocella sp.]
MALAAPAAHAHAVAGARVFVNTLLIDDPGVGDEASMPVFSVTSPESKTTDFGLGFEWDKTIFSNLAVGAGTNWDLLGNDVADGGKTHAGFGNPFINLKYRWIVLPAHEFISSVGVERDFGRAGTAGFDDGFNSTTLSAYAGKGLGDIPVDFIRPFAVTGEFDYTIPDAGPSSGAGDVTTYSGGLTLQYSIPYLQSQVKDYGLPQPLANLTPLVELGWSSAAGSSAFRPTNNPTTFQLGTGAVWTGQDYSFSTEMLWPLNGASGRGLGVIGQFHLYFDDLFPNTIGKPLFGA